MPHKASQLPKAFQLANWLRFDKIKEWEAVIFPSFQYDHVTDEQIAAALSQPHLLGQIEISRDWQCDAWLEETTAISELDKHAWRVASLVNAFRSGDRLRHAVELDTFALHKCGYGIGNGHHRVRALQYLGLTAGPFALSGHVDALRDLVAVAGCDVPADASQFVAEELLQATRFDIKPKSKRRLKVA